MDGDWGHPHAPCAHRFSPRQPLPTGLNVPRPGLLSVSGPRISDQGAQHGLEGGGRVVQLAQRICLLIQGGGHAGWISLMQIGHCKAGIERRRDGLAVLWLLEVQPPYRFLQQNLQHLQPLFDTELFASHIDLDFRKRWGGLSSLKQQSMRVSRSGPSGHLALYLSIYFDGLGSLPTEAWKLCRSLQRTRLDVLSARGEGAYIAPGHEVQGAKCHFGMHFHGRAGHLQISVSVKCLPSCSGPGRPACPDRTGML